MATLPDLPLPQTLRMLDRADVLRQAAAVAEPTREQLVEHLQTVCKSLGHPLDDTLAQQVVEQELTHAPAPVLVTGGPLERPASLMEWEAKTAELNQQWLVQEPIWEHFERIADVGWGTTLLSFVVGGVLAFVWGFLKMIYAPDTPLSTLDVNLYHGAGWLSLAALGVGALSVAVTSYWLRGHPLRREARKKLKHQREALEALPLAERPTVEDIATWCQAPGVSAACHQILTSGVPFLRSDARTLERRYRKWQYEKERQETRDEAHKEEQRRQQALSQWDQDFQGLVHQHQPTSHPSI